MMTTRFQACLVAAVAILSTPALAQDSDGDGVPDSLDVCPLGDDNVDNYGAIGYDFEYAFPLDAQAVPQNINLAGPADMQLFNTTDIATPLGRGLSLDGSTSGVIIPDNPQPDGLDDGSFTVLFTIRVPPNPSGFFVLAKQGDPGTSDQPLAVALSGENSLFFLRYGGEPELPTYGAFGSIVVTDDQWHHVAIVYDRSNGGHYLYIDGIFQDAQGAAYHAAAHSTQPISIGGLVDPVTGAFTVSGVVMDLEDLYVLNEALTPTQIADHAANGFANGRPDACDPLCPGDLNADGVLDNGDIGTFINAFLSGDPIADFNLDGFLDNGDIGAFIAAFLAGC